MNDKKTKTPKKPKRRVHQNIWGNTYGYEGRKRVRAFDNRCLEKDLQDWINGDDTIGIPSTL